MYNNIETIDYKFNILENENDYPKYTNTCGDNFTWDLETSKLHLKDVLKFINAELNQRRHNLIFEYLLNDALEDQDLMVEVIDALNLKNDFWEKHIYHEDIAKIIFTKFKKNLKYDYVYRIALKLLIRVVEISSGHGGDLGIMYLINHCKEI